MLIHHVLSVTVIYGSYSWAFTRVGTIVMLILDPADVPLHLAKLCKYAADSNGVRIWQTMANYLFEIFAVTFFVTRIICYGFVIYSVFFEGALIYIPNFGGPGGAICSALLVGILLLQVYWFVLIIKVAIKFSKDGEAEDVRSDDEDESPLRRKPNGHDQDFSPSQSHWKAHPPSKMSASYEKIMSVVIGLTLIVCICPLLSVDSIRAELEVLLRGLATTLTGSQAERSKLPEAEPDLTRDACVVGVFTVIVFLINWGVRLLFVEPFAKATLNLQKTQLVKFAQSASEAMFYGTFAYIGIRIVPSQPWSWPSDNWWKDFSTGSHLTMRSDLRCYYLLYEARYLQAAVSVLLEAKRKDFAEMMTHHIVTIVVVIISYCFGWNRVGVAVMVLLDPADVPLHLAKLCKYTAEQTKRSNWMWQYLADRLFEVFAVLFFVTRLIMYGYVCWSATVESKRHFDLKTAAITCVLLLYALLALQIYWFGLIVKVAMKLLRGNSVDDPRSDDEDEVAAKPKGKAKKDQ